MFPIGDDNTGRNITPWLNYLFIATNLFVFFVLQGGGTNERFTYAFSTVPAEIVTGRDITTPDRIVQDPITGDRFRAPGLQPTPVSVYLTLFTSMFMHGGIAHILGNMLYLWIFGDNLEWALGRARYLAFYLLTGVLASLAHVFTTVSFGANATVPSLGASGAISGVLGGYIVLFPHRRVRAIVMRLLTTVPAWAAIGLWFLFQVISGAGVLGKGSQEGGVAYAAHIGGFLAGMLLVKAFAGGRKRY
jgi:membrane associated rhomboid family serine protease